MKDSRSKYNKTDTEVPQGSVLGLLLLIYDYIYIMVYFVYENDTFSLMKDNETIMKRKLLFWVVYMDWS